MNNLRRKYLLAEASQLIKELWGHIENGDLTSEKFFELRERQRIFFGEVIEK